jgi:tRNA(Ile)-lysidine synthase
MPAPDLLDIVVHTLTGNCGVAKGASVLVCVSGGVDSMVLLHLMCRAATSLSLRLGVIHVDHGLRGDASRGDAAFVEDRCSRLGLPFHLVRLYMDPETGGLEEAARTMRYRAVLGCMKDCGYAHAATGHNADDQAETLIYRAARGTGVRGLAGMACRRQDGIIRPLLGVTRALINGYAEANRLEFRADATNDDTALVRNLIRKEVVPVLKRINPAAVLALASLAGIARSEGEVMDDLASYADRECCITAGSLARVYSLEGLASVPEPILRRLLINAVSPLGGIDRGIEARQVESALCVIRGEAAAHEVHRRVRISREGGLVLVQRMTDPPYYRYVLDGAGPREVHVHEVGLMVYVNDIQDADGARVLRSWMEGDRVGGRKVCGCLAEFGVPAPIRPLWPVLESGGRIVGVASGVPGRGPLVVGEKS